MLGYGRLFCQPRVSFCERGLYLYLDKIKLTFKPVGVLSEIAPRIALEYSGAKAVRQLGREWLKI